MTDGISAHGDRMPGDAEAAGAFDAIREEQAGWSAGDLLTFAWGEIGITEPTLARVVRVFAEGRLHIETVEDGWHCVIPQSRVVARVQ